MPEQRLGQPPGEVLPRRRVLEPLHVRREALGQDVVVEQRAIPAHPGRGLVGGPRVQDGARERIVVDGGGPQPTAELRRQLARPIDDRSRWRSWCAVQRPDVGNRATRGDRRALLRRSLHRLRLGDPFGTSDDQQRERRAPRSPTRSARGASPCPSASTAESSAKHPAWHPRADARGRRIIPGARNTCGSLARPGAGEIRRRHCCARGRGMYARDGRGTPQGPRRDRPPPGRARQSHPRRQRTHRRPQFRKHHRWSHWATRRPPRPRWRWLASGPTSSPWLPMKTRRRWPSWISTVAR